MAKVPERLRQWWKTVKKVWVKIVDFLARIFLTIFYFICLVPFAILARLTGDPLSLKDRKGFWSVRDGKKDSFEDMKRQF
ncbi:MAG: hypothetical protein ABIJ27_03520 [Candidatus Omnitrophota bacterium]